MNNRRRLSLYHSFDLPSCLARSLLLSVCWLSGIVASHAIDSALCRSAWKLKYGVTDPQITDSAWLAKDSDGDGWKNVDEITTGTNPFDAKKRIAVTNFAKNGNAVDIQFSTELGKLYQVQFTTTLANPSSWALHATPIQTLGDGTVMTLSAPYLANSFYRISVTDFDTDSDGLSDWVERAASLNPSQAQTVPGTDDYTYVSEQVALPNVVSISAAEPFASEDGPTAGRLKVTRTQTLFPLTLSYNVGGTAQPNTDYTPLAGTVTFPPGRSASADIFVNPKIQSTLKGGRSVTTALAAPGSQSNFELGTPSAATVIINTSTAATGTGLLARYYDTASSTYADAANFGQAGAYSFVRGTPTTTGSIVVTYIDPAISGIGVGSQVKLSFSSGSLNNSLYNNLICPVTAISGKTFTVSISVAAAFSFATANGNCVFSIQSFTHPGTFERVDSTVNFDWQHGTPSGVTIAPLNSPDNYSSIWECYLNPTVAGNYSFQLDADDKAEVLLDTGSGLTQIVQHNWTTPGSDAVGTFKQSAPIALVVPSGPAQRYRLVVRHVETTGDARCRLQWLVPGTTAYANIPQANVFTHTQAVTYSYSAGNLVVTPTGGHTYSVGNTVQLAFSTGALFTPGATNTYNGTYTISAVNGTTTFTVPVSGLTTTTTATTTAGSPTLAVTSIAGLAVGMAVTGSSLPANEFITAIAPGLISVTTGSGVTAQAGLTITAALPTTGSALTGSGFVLGNSSSTTTGLYNLCYANTAATGSPGRVGVDSTITGSNNGIWSSGSPNAAQIQPDTFSVRWSGQVQPQFTEDYTFVVQSDDGCTLKINGQQQTLMPAPSTSVGGTNNYIYRASTGEVVVNYSSLAATFGSFLLGETVRLDPTSGNLSHAPTTSPTYTYDSSTGLAVIDYSNLISTAPGGTVIADSFAVGEIIELDPTTGSLNALSTFHYPITAVSGNTFTVNFGTGVYASGTGNITIADVRNAVITKLYATGSSYSYNTGTGLAVIDYTNLTGVPAGSFPVNSTVELIPASGNLNGLFSTAYTVTATSGTTFTVSFGAGAFATGTGTMNIRAQENGPIPLSQTSGFAFNMGTGKYTNGSLGNMSVEIMNKPLKDWSSMGNERFVRIPMIGGVRYDIQLDYMESGAAARCFLSWFSPSQTKQIIPAERLYPSSLPQAPPAHVSATAATALAGGSFSYQVGGSNGANVSVSGNPPWLSYSNGVLSGTPPSGAAGDYQILITTTNGAGTSTSVLNLHVDENPGTVPREFWSGLPGNSVSSIPTATAAASNSYLTALEGPTNSGSDFGARIRGYITAPVTGNYYFWIAANNSAELWISNDDEPVNKFRRAVVATGSSTVRNWSNEAGQKSPWLALEQGQKYYFEVLHKAGSGTTDNLAVGWSKPGEATTAPSQVVPGFVLSPYVAPAAGSTPGTLYVSTMLSQNGAITKGVGNSTLRLSEDENTAYMTRTHSGLTGPITSEHIHVDPYLTHPSTIVFDIDTPATAGDGLQPDGRYKWTILPVGTLSKADIIEIIKAGKAYINLHTAAYPNGEIRGNYTLANGTRTFSPPPAPPAVADDHTTNNGAVRFLTQATFGPTLADIQAVKAAASYEAWIDDQFTKPATPHLPEVLSRELADVFGSFDTKLSSNTWWKNSISSADQLRQRIAFALSEIHVVSGQGPLEDNSLAISHFYDTLLTNAFGNFRAILGGTTLTPGMGRYLDMLRNDKPDLSVGRTANENYAREIKQLFSIGLYRMWPDGTLMLNSKDTPIDTYSQREVVGLAHTFTGWDYGYDGETRTSFSAPSNWMRPMRETPARHFTGAKRVLNNEVLPGLSSVGGQPLDPYATHNSTHFRDAAYSALPAQEFNAVHDMLFNHPNVGPFICRQLIQRLVTSSPSRDYLYRVVQKFNDNGSGVRGDMKAVIKAILLDYEARSPDLISIPAYGKQREPVLRVTAAARAFRAADLTGGYTQNGSNAITITTSAAHLLQAGNNVQLEFTDTSGNTPPAAGTYAVASVGSTTQYTINSPGWMTGTYNQLSGSNVMTVTMSGHWLPAGGQAWFDFTSGTANGNASLDQKLLTVATSTAFDTPSGVGNVSGTTFTLTSPDTTARSGNVMIARFAGSYSCTGAGGTITIDTSNGGTGTYGMMANHGLSEGDTVFLNFTNSRDTTSFNETSTQNDLVYTIVGVPDATTFTVTARSAANAAINSDNQVVIFPLETQPLVRSGTINTVASTFTMDNTDVDIAQTPLYSPTVFNFFLPDYKFSGTLASQGITTPEFQLTAETSAVYQANFLYNGLFNPSNTTGISSFKSGTNALVLDFSTWMSNATDKGLGAGPVPTEVWTSNANVSTLIDRFNTLLLAGQLPAAAKTAILNLLGGQISSISTGNPCTITMGSAHGLQTGDSVTITGVSGGTFSPSINATFTITVPAGSTTTFTVPVNCTSISGLLLTNSNAGIISYTNAAPSATNIRDRLRNILHLILTSPDYTIQR